MSTGLFPYKDKWRIYLPHIIQETEVQRFYFTVPTERSIAGLEKYRYYSVIYHRIAKKWSCTCIYFSAFGKGKYCMHIKACEYKLRQQGKL